VWYEWYFKIVSFCFNSTRFLTYLSIFRQKTKDICSSSVCAGARERPSKRTARGTGGVEDEHKSSRKRFLICCERRIIVFCCFCTVGGGMPKRSGVAEAWRICPAESSWNLCPLCRRCKRRTLLFFGTIHRIHRVCQPIYICTYQCIRVYIFILFIYIYIYIYICVYV
jgi:hypothetical protein